MAGEFHGLQQIASYKKDRPTEGETSIYGPNEKDAWESPKSKDLEEPLEEIKKGIEGPKVPGVPVLSNEGIIDLDDVSKIKSITIGGTSLTPERIIEIKNKIINSSSYNVTTDKGRLNLSDFPEFITTAEVIISY